MAAGGPLGAVGPKRLMTSGQKTLKEQGTIRLVRSGAASYQASHAFGDAPEEHKNPSASKLPAPSF